MGLDQHSHRGFPIQTVAPGLCKREGSQAHSELSSAEVWHSSEGLVWVCFLTDPLEDSPALVCSPPEGLLQGLVETNLSFSFCHESSFKD